jgi:hypothetical protein
VARRYAAKAQGAVVLLRDLEWIKANRADVGATLWLDLRHVGVRGEARVTAIEPSPGIAQVPGRLVTGTFKHKSGIVYELRVEGEAEPIRVTGRHPFWSVDRHDWVPVKELMVGERLKALNASARVESLTLREEPEPVYNIEVDGDHCYRVGEQRLLVHNASVGPLAPPQGATNCCPEVTKATATEFELKNSAKPTNFIFGQLVKGGEMSFYIENTPKDGTGCPGRWMFDQMMQHFGASVKAIQGNWVGANSDNLQQFNKLTAGGTTSPEAAAKQTWTGMQASNAGFSQVQVVSTSGSPGNYTNVNVVFKK